MIIKLDYMILDHVYRYFLSKPNLLTGSNHTEDKLRQKVDWANKTAQYYSPVAAAISCQKMIYDQHSMLVTISGNEINECVADFDALCKMYNIKFQQNLSFMDFVDTELAKTNPSGVIKELSRMFALVYSNPYPLMSYNASKLSVVNSLSKYQVNFAYPVPDKIDWLKINSDIAGGG